MEAEREVKRSLICLTSYRVLRSIQAALRSGVVASTVPMFQPGKEEYIDSLRLVLVSGFRVGDWYATCIPYTLP